MKDQVVRTALMCVIVFLGAFLLFQIEPLIGKIVTLHYGGTASVWTICILFFQGVVLAGYFVTFLLSKLSPRSQIIAYVVLALASIYWSTIPTGSSWDCTNVAEPVSGLLYSLTVHLAVPCIILATISGMMQLWFALQNLGNPYPLYSVSNIGSIGALLAYPTLIEPTLTISKTLSVWSWLYWVLVAVLLVAAVITWLSKPTQVITRLQSEGKAQAINPILFLWWVGLSAMGSVTLLAYTSYISGDIAPMPLIWVLPLSLYLLTFVLVFSNYPFYRRVPYVLIWITLIVIEPLVLHQWQLIGLILNLVLVFVTCMICHGELVAIKPVPIKLPTFYLALAIGGAVGGVFVGLIAPNIFDFEAERLIVVFAVALLLLYHFALKKFIALKNYTMVAVTYALVLTGIVISLTSLKPKNLVHWERNFYSSVRVLNEGELRTFCSGRINHGQQFRDKAREQEPAGAYWVPVSLVINYLRETTNHQAFNCGDVGLGVGVLAAFGRPDDRITFYELDPKVEVIAKKYFTYLTNTKAQIAIHIGDGRAVLDNQPPQDYDLLLIDAFNGDAIPCHLLTKEALQIYLKHLKQNGLLVFHISNNYLDLRPILGDLAQSLGLHSTTIKYAGGITYVVMSRDPAFTGQFLDFYAKYRDRFPSTEVTKTPVDPKLPLWTDDYTNLASVLKFK